MASPFGVMPFFLVDARLATGYILTVGVLLFADSSRFIATQALASAGAFFFDRCGPIFFYLLEENRCRTKSPS
jgi:hypothetical protein